VSCGFRAPFIAGALIFSVLSMEIPLLFFELKNIHKDIRRAYNENLSDYKDNNPEYFPS